MSARRLERTCGGTAETEAAQEKRRRGDARRRFLQHTQREQSGKGFGEEHHLRLDSRQGGDERAKKKPRAVEAGQHDQFDHVRIFTRLWVSFRLPQRRSTGDLLWRSRSATGFPTAS
jgi:hypothetical protein